MNKVRKFLSIAIIILALIGCICCFKANKTDELCLWILLVMYSTTDLTQYNTIIAYKQTVEDLKEILKNRVRR